MFLNTPIPEKTGSCMQARLNSPQANNNMADWMWVDLNQGKNRIHVRSKLPCTPEQTIRKRKGLSHKCCVAATCINRSCNWLLIPRVSFGSMDIKQRTKTWKSVWKGQITYFATARNKFCCSQRFLLTDFLLPWTKEEDEKSLLRAEMMESRCEASAWGCQGKSEYPSENMDVKMGHQRLISV